MAHGFYKDSICLFNGYLADMKTISQQTYEGTKGKIKATNPAELISYMFSEYGPRSLVDLNGVFAFALWQPDSGKLWLGGDRFGMRPLYYLHRANSVKFASEIKALSYNDDNLSPNYAAMEEMFVFGFLLGDKTPFQDIQRVPPATVLEFHRDGLRKHRYWWFDRIEIDPKLGVDAYIEENNRLFKKAIARTSEGLDEVICFLSGGYDSRRIALELARCGKKIRTYTTAYVRPGEKYEVESEISKKVSAEIGAKHSASELAVPGREPDNIHNMYTLLDFESDEHQFIMPLLSEIPTDGGVNFDGLGGDILINGLFLKEDILSVIHDNKKVAEKILDHNPNLWSSYMRRKIEDLPLEERILQILDDLPDSPNKLTLFFFVTRTRREISIFPYGLLSMKIESFLPYLDYELADFSLRLSPTLKCGSNLQEKILRLDDSDLMNKIPTSHYPDISSNPDDLCLPYCRPVNDYWTRVKREVFATSCREILTSGDLFFSLKLKGMISTMGFSLLHLLNFVPESAIERGWALRKLGQIALFHKMIKDREWRIKQLTKARDSVFKGAGNS